MAYECPEGLTEKEWCQFLGEMERTDTCLRDLVCPDCGNPLMKLLDRRQMDDVSVGTWFSYRCTNPVGCSFLMDQCELA